MFKANAQAQERIVKIIDALEELSPGETITYRQLSKVAGEAITGGSWMLQAALRKSEKRTGSIYDNVHGQGYQRLETKDVPGIGKKANTRVRRIARKTRQRFENIRANDLSPNELATHAAYRGHFAMIEGLATERSVRSMELNVEPPAAVTTLADKMRDFMAKK